MAVDQRRIKDFLRQNSLRGQIANVVESAGFSVVWVTEDNGGDRWGLYLQLPPRLRALFGTGREVLMWVVQAREFQSRTVMQAEEIIREKRPRLCEDFAIVVTHDPKTSVHAAETAETLDTIFLGFSVEELGQFRPWGDKDFAAALQHRLYARDLYDLPTAVTRSEDFFGRRAMVTEIATRLREGSRHVGLFGLRKIGKTSLLYRLNSVLKNGNIAYSAHVDVERIDAINPRAEYLVWSLGEAIYDAHRQIRKVDGLLLLGKYGLYSSIEHPDVVFELFDHDIRLILAKISRRIVLMFDEIELLSPKAPGSLWGDGFVRIWRLLRGLDQQFPNRLSYFVTGTNPSVFEVNHVGGLENPVYNYFSVEYLRPLVEDDVENLLTGLGTRIGLSWNSEAVSRVFKSTGGHPALVRALASLVHRANSDRQARAAIAGHDVDLAVDKFFVERSSLLSQVVAVLGEQYPDEYFLLELLASGQVGEFRECAEAFPSDTAHLVGYGLCVDPEHCKNLEIELLQTFIQRRARRRTASSGDAAALQPGDFVEDYKVIASIGVSEGFARVYSAHGPDQNIVALKVFKNGLLSALQRELEPLQEIDHQHVIRVLDYGTSDSGLVYMAMEYLEGNTLKHFCTRSTRAPENLVFEWLSQLLSAMACFHPDEGKIKELREVSEISQEELAELEDARHGFVHRDVKPENVMACERGAVLIDFNISVRASAQVVTRSFTPGYHPPDGIGEAWSPDLDLYQLGLTMLQVALGLDVNAGRVEDLRTLAKEELSKNLADILLKLTGPEKKDRYLGATQAEIAIKNAHLGPDVP
jgi:hypothetical protein